MAKKRAYIGFGRGRRTDAIMTDDPTAEAWPQYWALWGPFSSLKRARWIAGCCRGNPHMGTVAEAERIYKQEAKGEQ